MNTLGYDYMMLGIKSFALAGGVHRYRTAKRIPDGYDGSAKEYEDVVVQYWKPYGIRPKRYWYRLYCAGMDHYDPRFIPGTVWFGKIIPYFNNLSFKSAYTDKAMLSRLFPDVRQPVTVIKNMGGSFYNGAEEPITRDEAEKLCLREEHLIFKPTIESGGGMNIRFFDADEMPADRIGELFDCFNANFIVQQIVQQHPDLARINASTLNTMRVLSFRFHAEGDVSQFQHCLSSLVVFRPLIPAGPCRPGRLQRPPPEAPAWC